MPRRMRWEPGKRRRALVDQPRLPSIPPPPSRECVHVAEVYAVHFHRLEDTAEAWNRTLEELAPPFSQDMPFEASEERRKISNCLHEVRERVEYDEGDPFTLAVWRALHELERQGALKAAREHYDGFWEEVKEQADKERISVDEYAETIDEWPQLYIYFTNDGEFDGWSIDYPSYHRGWGGPYAQVQINSDLNWQEIKSEIEQDLSEEDIDWEIEEENP